ncbi:uncharacterized protein BP5553_05080 [Venustampulla echinocandica]|uniref:Uncharacterized protein n=1 Tax=Venustampulla echinocandica TaxID=2656787 RepID=A0A370TQ40_9HELO|nr:uncharacterized protein BP5553_05080 [Venustampulla echinocandica]RDL37647.1 hypothetical protein BP5553_05080 [Venustampulla echinocandica]
MAAKYRVSPVSNTPLSNRYIQDDNGTTAGNTRLPTGACNFTNLSAAAGGGSAPKCGCRRYWDKALGYPEGQAAKSGFCMCEHHACFHDHEPEDTHTNKTLGDLHASQGVSSTSKQPDIQQVPFRIEPTGRNPIQETYTSRRTAQESQLPDTLRWSRSIPAGSPEGLPAIPSQCLIPSDNGSGTSGSQTRYLRPFGGLGLETLSNIQKRDSGDVARTMKDHPLTENTRALEVYEDANGNAYMQSITEAATPSARASQDIEPEFARNISDVQDALEKIVEESRRPAESMKRCIETRSSTQVLIKQSDSVPGMDSVSVVNDPDDLLIPKLRNIIGHMAKYPTTVQNHERRLDLLENASFTHPAVEDLQEGHNIMDMRVGELEGRLEELEKAQIAQNDVSSVGSQQHAAPSIDSRISTTSSAMVVAAMHQVDSSRVEALEAQVAELQASAPPSHTRPWEVEVVFLPFGSNLMGVWPSQDTLAQRSRGNSTATDGWTQTQNNSLAAAQACLTAHDRTSTWEKSMSDFATDDASSWLMARACKARSRVDERLRSRGLVKLIQICGPDARDVQAAMMSAFGDLPGLLAEDPFTQHDDENKGATPSFLSKYLGLQASWVPLRKLHKDSSLRFLNPSEMLTPALWTAQFLTSSVAMRTSGTRRLFVTQRDSYIQHLGPATAWTWQKLRQLPRVYQDQSSFDHTPEADAHEPCWEFDERLDSPPLSLHSSFASQISSLSIRSFAHKPASPSNHSSSGASTPTPNASSTSTSVAPPADSSLSPIKGRNPFRPIHIRTSSLPSIAPLKSSPSQPGKRRIASFDHETQSSPTRATPSILNLTLKRRRISRSPSRPCNTPRWSVGPPSPFAFMDDIAEPNKRGTTPFAYATPHSNAPYIDPRPRSDVDIEIYQDEYDDDELGSTTDELDLGVDESGGWEQNALSDYEPEPSDEEASKHSDSFQARQLDDEWEGVQDLEDGSRLPGRFGSIREVAGHSADVDRDDAQSDASSQPSEYPSTQYDMFSRSKAGFKIHVDEEADAGV